MRTDHGELIPDQVELVAWHDYEHAYMLLEKSQNEANAVWKSIRRSETHRQPFPFLGTGTGTRIHHPVGWATRHSHHAGPQRARRHTETIR
jgi:hypothetical protein